MISRSTKIIMNDADTKQGAYSKKLLYFVMTNFIKRVKKKKQ